MTILIKTKKFRLNLFIELFHYIYYFIYFLIGVLENNQTVLIDYGTGYYVERNLE